MARKTFIICYTKSQYISKRAMTNEQNTEKQNNNKTDDPKK